VLPSVLLLGIAYAATRMVGRPLESARPRASAIVWDGRVFMDRGALARWLQSRGRSYEVWARRHPKPSTVETRATRARPSTDAGRALPLSLAGALAAATLLLAFRRRHARRATRTLGKEGARLMLRATGVVSTSCSRAGSRAVVTWHGHNDLVWYVAGALLVAGTALLAAWT
jgi:hypothetical protein